jgi:hypothetical protein
MANANIEEIRGLADPLRQYQFNMIVANPYFIDTRELTLRCSATSIPGFTQAKTSVILAGHEVHYAGRRTYSGTWSCTVLEGVNFSIYQGLRQWMNRQWETRSGRQFDKTQYETTAILEQLGNQRNVVSRHRIIGLFPEEVPEVPFSTESSEAVSLDLTWSYDYSEVV